MALIECPECGKEVSDAAQACPSCGATMPKGCLDTVFDPWVIIPISILVFIWTDLADFLALILG
jgi:hypothetical protein